MKGKINHIDGWLYVGMGIAAEAETVLTSSDAQVVMSAVMLFWVKWFWGTVGAACLAGKTYRSTTFADKQTQDANANVVESETHVIKSATPTAPASDTKESVTTAAPLTPPPVPATVASTDKPTD